MSFNALQTITGKVRTRSPFQALSSRYTFLSLREAEPNLGIPGPAGIAPTNDGIRYPVLSNALSGVSAWRVFAYDNPKIAAYSKVNALAIGDNAFVGPTKNSIVYSNYVFGGNRFNSTALADNSFNVYSLSGIYLYNPTTVGDPLSAIAFVVDENGNTGIGIDSPREKLDVIGNVRASGTLSADNLGLFGSVNSHAAFTSHYVNVKSLSSRWANLLSDKIALISFYPGQYTFKDNTLLTIMPGDGNDFTTYAYLKYAAFSLENYKANFYAITAFPIYPGGNDLLDSSNISYYNNKTIVQFVSAGSSGTDVRHYEIYDATDPFNPVLQKNFNSVGFDYDNDYSYVNTKVISYSTNTTPVSNYRIKVNVSGFMTCLYYNNDLSDVREIYNAQLDLGGVPLSYIWTNASNMYQVSAGLWHLAIYNAPFFGAGFGYYIFKFDNTGIPQSSSGIPYGWPLASPRFEYPCTTSVLSGNILYTLRNDGAAAWVSRFNNVPGNPLTTVQAISLSSILVNSGIYPLTDFTFSQGQIVGNYLVFPSGDVYDPDNTSGFSYGAAELRLKLNTDGTIDAFQSYVVQSNSFYSYGPRMPNYASIDDKFNINNVGDTSFVSKVNYSEINTLQVKNLSFSKSNVIVPTTITDTGKFLTLNVNGEQKAIRLWDYTT
jgi:hypothetical protein